MQMSMNIMFTHCLGVPDTKFPFPVSHLHGVRIVLQDSDSRARADTSARLRNVIGYRGFRITEADVAAEATEKAMKEQEEHNIDDDDDDVNDADSHHDDDERKIEMMRLASGVAPDATENV